MSQRMIVLIVLLLTLPLVAAAAETCPVPEPEFAQALSTDGVVGVVERHTLARNPLPWGASVSVAIRIWGGIRAERWKTSDWNLTSCPDDPSALVGTLEYDFRGTEAEWEGRRNEITRPTTLSPDESLLLDAQFGSPESFEVSSVDRFMAGIRVWGLEAIVAGGLLIIAISRAVLSGRRKRYDRHLF